MAMPANLTSFCMEFTYDTFPSPANLKRWRTTTEAMCTLCSKDVCTTAHILGACKVSLQQGRYTFRHDTVLRGVIEVLKTLILNIKDTVPISPKSPIKFVRKGTKLPRKRTPPVGILHHASHWILLADLNKTYCFPVDIAFIQLRPDITVFSNSLRKVILIELTCPCEENMESWHGSKINKYSALKTIIESKVWCVELFAVEVGARGYCSRSVLCCFKKLGFNNKLIRNTIKKLSKSSMEFSFSIWLARNNKEWTPGANCKLNDSSKETYNSESSMSSLKQTTKPGSNAKTLRPVGFINKGNTCYAKSILQILSVTHTLWNRAPLESNTLSPMLRANSLNMTTKKNSSKPVDPSNFLWALKRKLSNLRGVPFDFNTKQDVAEILQVVLDELKGVLLAGRQLISNTQKITVSCNSCFCFSESEQNLDILTLPVSVDIQASISQFLKLEILSSHNKWFCPSYKAYSESTRGTCFINSAPFNNPNLLILQSRWSTY